MRGARYPTVAEIVSVLERCYPPALAEPWDQVGLHCGDLDRPVPLILLAVDPAPEVVAEAVLAGAGMLVTHHPLALAPVRPVTYDPAGSTLHRLASSGIAYYVAHTNADSAAPGVSDALAAALGLVRQLAPLDPRPPPADKLVTFVPDADVDRLVDTLAAAGAGSIGEYRRCAFLAPGTGTFVPGAAANPSIGRPGEREEVPETRVEMIMPRAIRAQVVEALLAAHPYEEPAYEVYEVAAPAAEPGVGLGRIGELARPQSLREFVRSVVAGLPATRSAIRVAGPPGLPVRRVAVCGGSGSDLLAAAARAGADVMLTADVSHHRAGGAGRDGLPAVVDVPHWASEWPWLEQAAAAVRTGLPGGVTVDTAVSRRVTDPWTSAWTGRKEPEQET